MANKKNLPDGRILIDYRLHGRRVREKYSTELEADLRLNEIERLRLMGHNAKPWDATIANCIDRWITFLRQRGRQPAYLDRIDVALNNIIPFLNQRGIETVGKLNKTTIDDYYAYRRKLGRKDQTILNEYRVVNSAINWAVSRDIVEKNPINGYRFDQIVHEIPEVPMPEDIQKIFDHLTDDDTRSIFYYILAMGSRFGETVALTAENIDAGNNTVAYNKSVKGGDRYRRTAKLRPMPFEFPARGRLFTLEGRPWLNRTLLSRIEGACALAGLPKITVHTLRHAHATFELAAGNQTSSIQALMARCGWRTMHMVSRYMEKSRTYELKDGHYLPTWPGNKTPNPTTTDSQKKQKHGTTPDSLPPQNTSQSLYSCDTQP